MWVQLGEESKNTNVGLFEIVEQLKSEMERLRVDNERLMQEKERIMKSISKKQNHRPPNPSMTKKKGLEGKEMLTKN